MLAKFLLARRSPRGFAAVEVVLRRSQRGVHVLGGVRRIHPRVKDGVFARTSPTGFGALGAFMPRSPRGAALRRNRRTRSILPRQEEHIRLAAFGAAPRRSPRGATSGVSSRGGLSFGSRRSEPALAAIVTWWGQRSSVTRGWRRAFPPLPYIRSEAPASRANALHYFGTERCVDPVPREIASRTQRKIPLRPESILIGAQPNIAPPARVRKE